MTNSNAITATAVTTLSWVGRVRAEGAVNGPRGRSRRKRWWREEEEKRSRESNPRSPFGTDGRLLDLGKFALSLPPPSPSLAPQPSPRSARARQRHGRTGRPQGRSGVEK